MRDHLPEEAGEKLVRLISEIPHDDHMIHGDYHSKNLELTNDEVLLIDMDTLAVGHPIFELASMYNAYQGFYEIDHDSVREFQGFDYETASEFWHKLLRTYLGTNDEDVIKDVEDKARIIGYTRLIRRSIRRKGLESAGTKAEIDHWTEELIDLLKEKESLTFERTMEATVNYKEIEVEATPENLIKVMGFIEENLDAVGAGMKAQMQIAVAVEELYINIAKYAYKGQGKPGMATVRFEVKGEPASAYITFIDQGVHYDPLAKADPDVTLSADERPIGGLGIFMVKKSMDDVLYEYKDGCNILTIVKAI
jgi:anti-sigma regulatory factor (Ser/Thr protein kinase)